MIYFLFESKLIGWKTSLALLYKIINIAFVFVENNKERGMAVLLVYNQGESNTCIRVKIFIHMQSAFDLNCHLQCFSASEEDVFST